jgi:hypothetical protein
MYIIQRGTNVDLEVCHLILQEIAHYDIYSLFVCLLTKRLLDGVEKSTILASCLVIVANDAVQ